MEEEKKLHLIAAQLQNWSAQLKKKRKEKKRHRANALKKFYTEIEEHLHLYGESLRGHDVRARSRTSKNFIKCKLLSVIHTECARASR